MARIVAGGAGAGQSVGGDGQAGGGLDDGLRQPGGGRGRDRGAAGHVGLVPVERSGAGGESFPAGGRRAGVLVPGGVVCGGALARVCALRLVVQFQRVGHGDGGAFGRGRLECDFDGAGPGGVGRLVSRGGLAVDLDGDAVGLAVGQGGRRDVSAEGLVEGRAAHARLHDGLQGLRVDAVAGLRDGLRGAPVVLRARRARLSPAGLQGDVLGDWRGEVVFVAVQVPAVEVVAVTLRVRFSERVADLDFLAVHGGAAVRVERARHRVGRGAGALGADGLGAKVPALVVDLGLHGDREPLAPCGVVRAGDPRVLLLGRVVEGDGEVGGHARVWQAGRAHVVVQVLRGLVTITGLAGRQFRVVGQFAEVDCHVPTAPVVDNGSLMFGQFRRDRVGRLHVGGGQGRQLHRVRQSLGFDVGIRPCGRVISGREIVGREAAHRGYRLDFGIRLLGSDLGQCDADGVELLADGIRVLVSGQDGVLPAVGVGTHLEGLRPCLRADADDAGRVGDVPGLRLRGVGDGVGPVAHGERGRGASEMRRPARIDVRGQGGVHGGLAGIAGDGVEGGQDQAVHDRAAVALLYPGRFDREDARAVDRQVSAALHAAHDQGDVGFVGRVERDTDLVAGVHAAQFVDNDVEAEQQRAVAGDHAGARDGRAVRRGVGLRLAVRVGQARQAGGSDPGQVVLPRFRGRRHGRAGQ